MNVRAGQMNVLPFVIWMTRLDTGNAVRIASPTNERPHEACNGGGGIRLILAVREIELSPGRAVQF